MSVVVIILRIIFAIPAIVFFLVCKLLGFIITIAGVSLSRAFEFGGGLLATAASSVLVIALGACLFGVDGLGFLKEYWWLLLILYVVAGIFIAMAEGFETVAEAIATAGEFILELVCPWMPV